MKVKYKKTTLQYLRETEFAQVSKKMELSKCGRWIMVLIGGGGKENFKITVVEPYNFQTSSNNIN